MAFTLSPLSVLAEPATLVQAKDHLRVTGDSEDAVILQKLTAAREYVEGMSWRSLALQVLEYTDDRFPSGGSIRLPGPPVLAVQSVRYVDTAGVAQVVDASGYVHGGSILRPVFGTRWPHTGEVPGAVQVVYTAGYVASLASYATAAEMNAAVAPETGSYAQVTADPDPTRNGSYRWSGTAWEPTGYTRLSTVPQRAVEAILLELGTRYAAREDTAHGSVTQLRAVRSLCLSLRP